MTQRAPEIFQTPLDGLATPGLPPRGAPEFEQAVMAHFALDYASRGWNALVTVDADFVRGIAVPLQRCLALDPDYVNAWIGQGVALARLGRDGEAAASLREALRRDPGNALAQRNLAAVEARAKDSTEESARQAKSRKALETLHAGTEGRPRMDAVFYMQGKKAGTS